MKSKTFLLEHPVVAILRGLTPERALAVGDALYQAGVRVMEVPLNSPDALLSIRLLAAHFRERALIGAGTVLDVRQVVAVAEAGGGLIVSPNADEAVIDISRRSDQLSVPGVCSPTEAFQALRAGADALKLFPAEVWGAHGLRALRAVLPPDIAIFAVGGVTLANLRDWRLAGANGVGIGSSLFKPGMSDAQISRAARDFVEGWSEAARVPAVAG